MNTKLKSKSKSKSKSNRKSKITSNRKSKSKSKDEKYKTRPSPPVSAQDHKNEIMEGNDGKEYISKQDKNGIFRWKLHNSLNKYVEDPNYRIFDSGIKVKYHKKHYFIHDNGGRPFYIEIYPDEIKIFAKVDSEDNEDASLYKYKKSFYNYKKIFVGKSPLTAMTKFSGGHGPRFDGNSILVNLDDIKYLYIGSEIYTFEPKEEIIKYISEVGNSDVPYPIAISKNNYYLMIENEYYPKILAQGQEDIYGVYYGHIKVKPEFDKTQVKKIKNKKIIHKRNL